MSVRAVSAAACWSGSLESVTPPSVHMRQPVPVQQDEYTPRWSGQENTSTMVLHVQRLAGPADGDVRSALALELRAMTRPASTPALTTTVDPATVMGATVPAVETGL